MSSPLLFMLYYFFLQVDDELVSLKEDRRSLTDRIFKICTLTNEATGKVMHDSAHVEYHNYYSPQVHPLFFYVFSHF